MTAIPSPAHSMKNRILRGAKLPDRPWSGVVILSLLLLSPLPLASELMRVDPSEGPALQISFTPHLTPLNLTFTPHPTPLQTLGPRVSPPPQPPKPVETPVPPVPISGGDATVGYDFIEGSETPTWRVWFEGEVIFIRPDDPAAVALLNAFQVEATERATALANGDSADNTLVVSAFTLGFGALSAAGGIIVAAPSCATVPLTFWAAGGTGWPCVGGVAAAVGGVGTFIVSAVVGIQAFGDKVEADNVYQSANAEAEDLFEALKDYASP